MINEWKDFYNNDYIIFSINNGMANDQYFSTKHILNTYQSRVEFIIDNIEDFSFKNEDYINSTENDFHINYANQVLEAEENDSKKKTDKPIEDLNKNDNNEKIQIDTLNSNEVNDPNEKTHGSEEPILENNENNKMSDEFLREEDFAIDNQKETNKGDNYIADTDDKFKAEKITNEEIKRELNYSIKTISKSDEEEKNIHYKEVSNLLFRKHDNNKKIDFNKFNNLENNSSVNEPCIKSSSIEKACQKDLKIEINKNDSPIEVLKESPEKYEIKKDNYKTLINNLKNQEQIEENNKYFSRIDKVEDNKINKDTYLNNIPNSDKLIEKKGNHLYPKDNENENLQISNSINSNNSNEFNNINSENNEIPDYDKYPKVNSRTQSFTIRSRDDEIKSLNDKLHTYKYQNKIILDENKKLLEIINIFKILQNLENSKKNTNTNNIDSINENLNLDSDGINREIENINKTNHLLLKKENSSSNIIKSEGNNLNQENKIIYNDNKALDNYGLLDFERFARNEKKSIKNINFSYANKFLNSNHFVIDDGNLNKPNKNEKIFRLENAATNNRYDNINESSSLKFKNNLMISEEKNEDENPHQEQRPFEDSIHNHNQNADNHNYVNDDVYKNVNEMIVDNSFSCSKNISRLNQNINISVNDSHNLISPSSNNSSRNMNSDINKKKTFIKIDENFNNKQRYYSKNYKISMNSTKSNNNDNSKINLKKFNNKVNYINTNSISTINTKIKSGSNKSKILASQSSIVFSNNPESPDNKMINTNLKHINKTNEKNQINLEINNFDKKKNLQYCQQSISNDNLSKNAYVNSVKAENVWYIKNSDYLSFNRNIENEKQNGNLGNNYVDKYPPKNYDHLIHYLEKYRELNDKVLETLENDKKDVKIDMNKRKKDVEYLEHILNYINSLGDNKESKDFIPFYLIDKRKLFENMVKYLYSKDEITQSTKNRNIRLYKIHNKLK